MNENIISPVAKTTKHELKPVRIEERARNKRVDNKRTDGKQRGSVDSPTKRSKTTHAKLTYIYAWQKELGERLDDMVDAFLDFPPDTPQEYQDEQFARHLLWHIGDARTYFVRLFRHGANAYELDCLWARLFPYLTGEYPEEISPFDGRLVDFSLTMLRITQDYIVGSAPFDELMKWTQRAVAKVRVTH